MEDLLDSYSWICVMWSQKLQAIGKIYGAVMRMCIFIWGFTGLRTTQYLPTMLKRRDVGGHEIGDMGCDCMNLKLVCISKIQIVPKFGDPTPPISHPNFLGVASPSPSLHPFCGHGQTVSPSPYQCNNIWHVLIWRENSEQMKKKGLKFDCYFWKNICARLGLLKAGLRPCNPQPSAHTTALWSTSWLVAHGLALDSQSMSNSGEPWAKKWTVG